MRNPGIWVLNLLVLCGFLAIAILPGICSGAINIGTTTYGSLEDAVNAASPGQTLRLVSNTPVTLTPGNITAIDKSLTLLQNDSTTYYLLLNGTIAFNGTLKTYTINQDAAAFAFLYDPTGPAVFRNNSLIEITGSSNTFTSDGGIHPSLTSDAFTGTGTNVTGNNNSFFSFIGETKTPSGTLSISNLSVVFNLSGSYNSISDSASSPLNTQAAGGVGLNIIGNFNSQIQLKTSGASGISMAPGGRIFISQSAEGNVIKDYSFDLSSPQSIYVYNGTSAKTTTSWYFFNSSWSPSGGNRNVTIAPAWTFPFSGNVSLVAGFSNVTGQSTDFVRNSSLLLDTSTGTDSGKSSGILTNYTSPLTFSSISAVVPVGMSIGNNTYLDTGSRTVSAPGTLGYVTILNFNPVYSLVGENFNSTQTTDWSAIPDFTAARNLTFVIDNATSHTPLGNISYNQDLDLTASGIGSGLAVLGTNLNMSSAGNSTNFTMTNTALNSVFNKTATVTVYPIGFSFSSKRDITVTATTDQGVSTVLFDRTWITRAGFVDSSANVTVGSGSITLPVLHFSRYDFGRTTNTSPITFTVGSGGDFSTLEEAMISADGVRDNDTLSLISDAYVTSTFGNLTSVDKILSLTSNGHKVLVNGTISFNGTAKGFTYTDTGWFTYNNPAGGTPYRNDSLIEIPGSSNFFNGSMPTLDAGSFGGTGVNITGSSNTINAMWNISGSGMPVAVNLTGSSNNLTLAGNISTTAGTGIAINLLGNTNNLS
ncbi:MAG: hypothetical protein ABFC24_10410, partial [Methanoregulaceae archaeon]